VVYLFKKNSRLILILTLSSVTLTVTLIGGSVLCIEDEFTAVVNSISWQPSSGGSSELIMASGNEPFIKLFDLRKASKPLHTLTGHQNKGVTRCKQIYHPMFCAGGAGIATQGERSEFITLFNTATGRVVSRSDCGGSGVTKIALVRDSLCVAATYQVDGSKSRKGLGLLDLIKV